MKFNNKKIEGLVIALLDLEMLVGKRGKLLEALEPVGLGGWSEPRHTDAGSIGAKRFLDHIICYCLFMVVVPSTSSLALVLAFELMGKV